MTLKQNSFKTGLIVSAKTAAKRFSFFSPIIAGIRY